MKRGKIIKAVRKLVVIKASLIEFEVLNHVVDNKILYYGSGLILL